MKRELKKKMKINRGKKKGKIFWSDKDRIIRIRGCGVWKKKKEEKKEDEKRARGQEGKN